jgi:hypothetical protein
LKGERKTKKKKERIPIVARGDCDIDMASSLKKWCLHEKCVVGKENVSGLIMIKVKESPPSIMVTRNLWRARVWVRDRLCKEKTHHPQYTLPKVSCIVV